MFPHPLFNCPPLIGEPAHNANVYSDFILPHHFQTILSSRTPFAMINLCSIKSRYSFSGRLSMLGSQGSPLFRFTNLARTKSGLSRIAKDMATKLYCSYLSKFPSKIVLCFRASPITGYHRVLYDGFGQRAEVAGLSGVGNVLL